MYKYRQPEDKQKVIMSMLTSNSRRPNTYNQICSKWAAQCVLYFSQAKTKKDMIVSKFHFMSLASDNIASLDFSSTEALELWSL